MVDVTTRLANGFVAVPVLHACRELGVFQYLETRPSTAEQLSQALKLNSGHVAVALRILQSLHWAIRQPDDRYTLTAACAVHHQIPHGSVAVLKLDLAALFGLPRKLPPDLEAYSHVYAGLVDDACAGWDVADDELRGLCDGLLGACTVVGMHQAGLLGAFAGGNISESGERTTGVDFAAQLKSDWVVNFATVHPVVRASAIRWLLHEGWAEPPCGDETVIHITLSGKFLLERALVLGTTVSYREYCNCDIALPLLIIVSNWPPGGAPIFFPKLHNPIPHPAIQCFRIQASCSMTWQNC